MVLTILVWVTAIKVGNEVRQFRNELNEFRGSVVYDIDKVRAKFLYETEFIYGAACRSGTEYPEEFRNVVGFNPNSPSSYCNDLYKSKWEAYLLDIAAQIGRKE